MTDLADATTSPSHRSFGARLRVAQSSLPIVSIAGARGKSTVAWMLHEILSNAKRSTGSWLSSGVYVDGELQDGELGPWSKVVLAARYGELDVVVQELVAATVIGAGLPKGAYPMAVLTTLCGNNEACLLSPDTIRERKALSIAVDAVHPDGVVIANADDYDVAELASSAPAETVFYALHRENPTVQRHLSSGGRATWLEEGWIVHGAADDNEPIMPIADVAAALDGEILFQAQNALAAVSVAAMMGIDPLAIRAALTSYEPRPDRQPAACNIVRFNDAMILIDAPRLVSSLKLLARGVRHTPHRRTLIVSGCFPRLSTVECVEAGRIVGGLGGIVILHGERAEEGRMDAVRSGLSSAAVPPIVLAMPDEGRAIDQLLNTIGPGDLALVLADDPHVALDRLWPAPRISAERLRGREATGGH